MAWSALHGVEVYDRSFLRFSCPKAIFPTVGLVPELMGCIPGSAAQLELLISNVLHKYERNELTIRSIEKLVCERLPMPPFDGSRSERSSARCFDALRCARPVALIRISWNRRVVLGSHLNVWLIDFTISFLSSFCAGCTRHSLSRSLLTSLP